MLLNLHVKNLAIIDEVDVYFGEHLNILTGETGAGKSIIIGSINLALGGKVSKDMIRKGADYALVELVFHLGDNAVPIIRDMDLPVEDGQLIISRKIMNGRSISKVNGETVTAALLKQIAGAIIDIHGQHEHQSLLYKKKHLEIIDRFSREEIGELKNQISDCYKEYISVKKEIEENVVDQEQRNREISFLEYEIDEIEKAELLPEEEEQLSIRYKKLSNAKAIEEGMAYIYGITSQEEASASNQIGSAVKMIGKLIEFDENLAGFSRQLNEIESLMSDFNRDLADYMQEFNDSGEEFARIDERLNLIYHLKSKYGSSYEQINAYYEESRKKLNHYRDYEAYMCELEKKKEQSEKRLEKLSVRLSKIRKKNADTLAEKIKNALVDMNFLDVQFQISIKKLNQYTENGFDDVEFLISTNPGEEVKPLKTVASGGELSRIMLAIKSVLADNDFIDTLIFDEIDVGVSGRTAQKVSEKLAVLSKEHQVICITHLPQIAAMADSHFIIEKKAKEDTTSTEISLLNKEQSVKELARILGGAKITKNVLANAKEMKELAADTKKY